MAIYRQIQTAFWQDDFVLQLTPEEKYFYLYLLTNSKTKQSGIYQLPMPVIIMETGYNQETAEKLLKRFIDYGKIIHNPKTKEIGIVNWPKYNPMESPKIRACVERELKDVKDKTLIPAIYPDRYPIQGVSQEEEEKEKEKEEAEEEEEKEERAHANEPAAAVDLYSSGTIPLTSCHPRPQLIGDPINNPETDMSFPRRRESIPPTIQQSITPLPECHSRPPIIGDPMNCVSEIPLSKGGEGVCLSDTVDYPDYTCISIQMQSELLFIRVWNKQKPNPEEIRIAADYIMKFTFNEVEIAFKEAVKYDRKKLAYVETVCEKRKERADLKKKTELERQKRLEQEKKLQEERKSGIGLGLIKTVFGDG